MASSRLLGLLNSEYRLVLKAYLPALDKTRNYREQLKGTEYLPVAKLWYCITVTGEPTIFNGYRNQSHENQSPYNSVFC